MYCNTTFLESKGEVCEKKENLAKYKNRFFKVVNFNIKKKTVSRSDRGNKR
jgi:hypothetical protein